MITELYIDNEKYFDKNTLFNMHEIKDKYKNYMSEIKKNIKEKIQNSKFSNLEISHIQLVSVFFFYLDKYMREENLEKIPYFDQFLENIANTE